MRSGQAGVNMVPINRMVPRSFITNLKSGATVHAGMPALARSIAFGGDSSVKQVDFSSDGGQSWHAARLGKDEGKYSFRRWEADFTTAAKGNYTLKVRCTNADGVVQPDLPTGTRQGSCAMSSKRRRSRPREEDLEMARMRLRIVLLAAVAMAPISSEAKPALVLKLTKVTLLESTAMFPPGPGSDTVNGNCLACHSVAMVMNQPVMPKAAWEAEVNKMRNVYKAPVPESDVAAIVDYLTGIKGPK